MHASTAAWLKAPSQYTSDSSPRSMIAGTNSCSKAPEARAGERSSSESAASGVTRNVPYAVAAMRQLEDGVRPALLVECLPYRLLIDAIEPSRFRNRDPCRFEFLRVRSCRCCRAPRRSRSTPCAGILQRAQPRSEHSRDAVVVRDRSQYDRRRVNRANGSISAPRNRRRRDTSGASASNDLIVGGDLRIVGRMSQK